MVHSRAYHVEQSVCGVGGDGLVVGVVRGSLLDLAEEILLDVELADMRDCAALDGIVGKQFCAVMDDSCVY